MTKNFIFPVGQSCRSAEDTMIFGNASVTGANGLVGSARCADRTPQRGVHTFRDRRITIFVLHP